MKLQKETKDRIAHGKWYGDACGTAFGLEVLGERWSLLIVRELLFGARRFSDLRTALPGISAKVLTERLESLAAWGVLARRQLEPPASGQVYELTEWGMQAEAVVLELGRWAARSPMHDPSLPVSPTALMGSIRTMQQADRLAAAPDMLIGLVLAGERFLARVGGGEFTVERGPTADCDAVICAPTARPLAGALYAGVPLAVLEAEAGMEISGDRALAEHFVTLFALPPKTCMAAPEED